MGSPLIRRLLGYAAATLFIGIWDVMTWWHPDAVGTRPALARRGSWPGSRVPPPW